MGLKMVKDAHDMSSLQPNKDLRHTAIIPKFVLDQSFRDSWIPKDWNECANDHANKQFKI